VRLAALSGIECALAAQVQARTQQRAAEGRQSKHLLESAHGLNLTVACRPMQGSPARLRVGHTQSRIPELERRKPDYVVNNSGVFVLDFCRRLLRGLIVAAGFSHGLISVPPVSAQSLDFEIVWATIGEVAAAGENAATRAGRQLFMASQLADFSLRKVTIARVDVEPTIVRLKVGERFCMTSLNVQAFSENRSSVTGAPLSVSMRQDHRVSLRPQRAKQDICFSPTQAGEYPVRLSSLLPARDGTVRGAQIFLRVQG
jgi:hypothetical protein